MSEIKNAGPVWIRYEIQLTVDTKLFDETWGSDKITISQGPLLRGTIRVETEDKTYSPSDPENLVQHIVDIELSNVKTILVKRYGEDNVKIWVDPGFVGDIKCIKRLELERQGLVKIDWQPLSGKQKARLERLRNPPQPSREQISIEIDERLLPIIDDAREEIPTEFGAIHYYPKRSRAKVIETLCVNALKINKWLKTQPMETQQRITSEAFRKPFFN